MRGRIENVLSWAAVRGYRSSDNPARWKGNLSELLPKPSKVAKVTHQPSLSQGDAAAWWADLQNRDGMAALALRFQTLTAARSGEVRTASWEDFRLGKGAADALWTVPADRMKNGKVHRVPLTADAVVLLRSVPRLQGSNLVFHAARGGTLSDASLSAVMKRMHAAKVEIDGMGYVDMASQRPAVPHGLRSTFRVWATEQGYDHRMAEIALAHWQGDETERACQRSHMLDRRRAMMESWAALLDGQGSAKLNVVELGAVGRAQVGPTALSQAALSCRGVHVAASTSDRNGVEFQTSARRLWTALASPMRFLATL